MKSFLRMTYVCVLCVLATTGWVSAQQRTIRGTIINEGSPVPGVAVTVKGTTNTVSSNNQGVFAITTGPGSQILVFNFVGMETQEVTVGSTQNTVDVNLKSSATDLDEVVVVGFGTQKTITSTGAVSGVTGKELNATPVSNVSQMLIGNAAGLSGLQSSGEPGRNTTNLYIRGISTFAGSQNPLVVIDGVQQTADRPFDQLNAMNPEDIDNVSILKDAGSTAVYGIRGGNGVIIVTTKRGKSGKPQLSFSNNFSMTKAYNLPSNVTSYEYALMRNEAIRTESSSLGNGAYNSYLFSPIDLERFKAGKDYTDAEVDAMTSLSADQKTALKASAPIYYGSRDLYKGQFNGTGPRNQSNLTINGGTDKMTYYTSLGYLSEGSILSNNKYYGYETQSKFNRYNFTTNFDIKAVKNLNIGIDVQGQFGKTTGPGDDSDLNTRYKVIMQYIYDGNPFMAPIFVDGKLISDYQGIAGSQDDPLGLKDGNSIGAQNSVLNLLRAGYSEISNNRLIGKIKADYTMDFITKGLKSSIFANFQDNYYKRAQFNGAFPVYTVRRNAANPAEILFFGGTVGTQGFSPDAAAGTNRTLSYEAQLAYDRKFGNHTVNGLIVANAQRYMINTDGNFNTPAGIMALVSRVRYNFKERYLTEFSMNYSGTEQFATGQRFGFFPSVQAGWVVSNEPFFPKTNIITSLKFRGSYGQSGNDKIGSRRYLYLPNTFNLNPANSGNLPGGYTFGTNGSDGLSANPLYTGAAEGTIGNPDVTWQRTKEINGGMDAKFISDKLSLTVDVYSKKTDNILVNLGTIPATYGVPSASVPPVNVGLMSNHGYDLTLTWNDNIKTVNYYLTAILGYARNKIVYRAEALNPYPWMNATGFSLNQYKGLLSDGFFNTQEDLNNRPYNTYTSNKAVLGDIRYKDVDGDGRIDNKDRVPIGYSNLPQYTMSLKAGFRYKSFEFNSLFIGSMNGSYYINPGMAIPFFKNAGNAFEWMYEGRWTPEKVVSGAEITYPRAQINGDANSNNFLGSDFWLRSNNFVRLKNVEVSYTFSKPNILKRTGISAIRVFANGNNLYTFTKSKEGIDPEQVDLNSTYLFPMTRVFNFGTTLRF